MPTTETVHIDESQFPESVKRDLLEGLRRRVVPPKFHYDSYRQAEKWLAVHEAHSPARTDPECAAIYDSAFVGAADLLTNAGARIIGLGCGGGQKDARLLQLLAKRGLPVSYLPCDTSVPLVLTAQHAAEAVVPGVCSDPLVCDIGACASLSQIIDRVAAQTGRPSRRLVTFFGMIPNFEPDFILSRLRDTLRGDDLLLISANLAPGPDYVAGVKAVLPGYDNPETREWLLCFLFESGIEPADGEIRFTIQDTPKGFKRIVADFHFSKPRQIQIFNTPFTFGPGAALRLFYSYRYQPSHIHSLLQRHHLKIANQWLTPSSEEAVFLTHPL